MAVINMDAHTKARELFLSYLSPDQRVKFDRGIPIQCIGNITKTTYKLTLRASGDILPGVYDEMFAYYCLVARGIPNFDAILIKKLLIENDESVFLRTAVITYASCFPELYPSGWRLRFWMRRALRYWDRDTLIEKVYAPIGAGIMANWLFWVVYTIVLQVAGKL